MFTGIIRATGRVAEGGNGRLSIRARLPRTAVGDSVCVGGVCLTLTRRRGGVVRFDLGPETLRRTTLGCLRPGDAVNLEPSLRAADALGGHIVSGHVDARAEVLETRALSGGCRRLRVELPARLAGLIVSKGSVAIDGVSLTVTAARAGRGAWFEVMIIPHTLTHTTLGHLRRGDAVNLEADMLARYVEGILGRRRK